MQTSRGLFVAAVLLAPLDAGRAHSELIPWSYQWNAHPIVVNADSMGPAAPPGGITLIPGAIAITGDSRGVARGDASIIAVNLSPFVFSPNPTGAPVRFRNTPYNLAVTLTDVGSGTAGSLKFAGVFSGTLTPSTADMQTTFTSAARQSIVLGGNLFTVTMSSFTPPGPPSLGSQGEIKAFVDVRPEGVPEPASLLLCGMGLVGAFVSHLGRRRE